MTATRPPSACLSESAVRPWPAGKRDLAMETMYEYGARVGFWRLMDIFDEHDVKSTFYVCAVALERNRKAAREIRERGHDVICHGCRWEDVTLLTREQEREHIRLAVKSIAETTGERPLGWYCRCGPSVNTRELVAEEGGFVYDSDAYNDDLPYWTMVGDKKHLVDPLLAGQQRFALRRRRISARPRISRSICATPSTGSTRRARPIPKMMSIGLHMRLAGHPARSEAVYEFIAYAKSFPDVWFAKRIDIARHWQENHA